MKTKLPFVLLLSLFISAETLASSFKLNFRQPGDWIISFDGYRYKNGSNSILINNVNPGNHYLEIIRPYRDNRGRIQERVVYQDYVQIPQHTRVVTEYNRSQFAIVSVSPERQFHRPPGFHLSQLEFRRFLDLLADQSFDSDKLILAKQVISQNTLKSYQIREIMETFSFESYRLEIARFSARRVADPRNYFVVNEALHFSSSIQELNHFLRFMHT